VLASLTFRTLMLWTCDVTLPYFDVHCRHPCTLTPSSALIGRVHSLEITTVDPVAGFRHSYVSPVTHTPLPRITPTPLDTFDRLTPSNNTMCKRVTCPNDGKPTWWGCGESLGLSPAISFAHDRSNRANPHRWTHRDGMSPTMSSRRPTSPFPLL
jgi:hypothetical protein